MPVKLMLQACPASWLYAVVIEFWAASAAASAICIVPVTIPGGKPVTEVPGLRPRSPLMTVGPVLVTVEAPTTPKVEATPRGGATAMALTPWASLPTAGGWAPVGVVGVRSEDLEPHPVFAKAT